MIHVKVCVAGLALAGSAIGALPNHVSAAPLLHNAKWHATVTAPGAYVTQTFVFPAHVPVVLVWDTHCPSSGENFVAVGIDGGQSPNIGGSTWTKPFGGSPNTRQHGEFTSRKVQDAFIVVSTDCSFEIAAYVGTSHVVPKTWSVVTDTTSN